MGDLFTADKGDVDLQQTDVDGKGELFINSGLQNLGIKGRTSRPAKVFEGNTITVDFWGNAFYRPLPYKLATHNHVFSLSGDIIRDEKVGLYLVSAMGYFRHVFSYAKMGTWSIIKDMNICLPADSNSMPDIDYMSERVRELEEERVRELEIWMKESNLSDCTITKEEKIALCEFDNGNKEMKEFAIGSLFDIIKGKRLTKANMKTGSINFVGATADNNGITNHIANSKFLHPANTITVTYNGSVGEAFYQIAPYWASDDVNVLYPKKTLVENSALFFLAPIRHKGKGYGYSFKWTKDKMKKDTIWLPVKNDGSTIDYHFMETYISAIKKQCIAKLKKEIDNEHEAYQKVMEGTST